MSFGLYIHIPFCASRCPYCDFAFVVQKTHLADRYTQAVITEYRARVPELGSDPTFETVYFGGGTPSAVPPGMLQQILEVVNRVPIAADAEITLEANPGDRDRFQALRTIGINRLSLGVQALDDRALKALGRFHNTADAVAAFDTARRAGFQNIGIDLIFGAPKQTLAEWQATLNRAIVLNPEHMSIYGLTVEPETAFGRRFQKGRLPLPTEATQADMYGFALDRLTEVGYVHYEVSNFARPGFASQHNRAYWTGKPYLGIGLSAHSFLNHRRAWNIRDLIAYIKKVETTGTAFEGAEMLHEQDRRLEKIMLGLRRREGISETLVSHPKTQVHLNRLIENQFLERTQGRIRLTRTGFPLADLVCAELVKEI